MRLDSKIEKLVRVRRVNAALSTSVFGCRHPRSVRIHRILRSRRLARMMQAAWPKTMRAYHRRSTPLGSPANDRLSTVGRRDQGARRSSRRILQGRQERGDATWERTTTVSRTARPRGVRVASPSERASAVGFWRRHTSAVDGSAGLGARLEASRKQVLTTN
jgi:hypothetical protein